MRDAAHIVNSSIINYLHNQRLRKAVALSENYKPKIDESLSNSALFAVYFMKIEAKMTAVRYFEKRVLYEIYSKKRTCPNTYCTLLYIDHYILE